MTLSSINWFENLGFKYLSTNCTAHLETRLSENFFKKACSNALVGYWLKVFPRPLNNFKILKISFELLNFQILHEGNQNNQQVIHQHLGHLN